MYQRTWDLLESIKYIEENNMQNALRPRAQGSLQLHYANVYRIRDKQMRIHLIKLFVSGKKK